MCAKYSFVRSGSVAVFAVILAAGCSIHPLSQDVTGYNTSAIVRKIRCEARDAVVDTGLKYLQREGYAVENIQELRALDLRKLKPSVRNNLEYFADTGIVYAFALEGTETNGLTFSADIIKPLTHGTGTLSPSFGNTLLRDNIRAFTISDNFGGLVFKVKDEYCNFESSGPNYEYPIVGRIGIDEMVRTFIALALTGDLGVPQDPTKPVTTLTPAGMPSMADTITFTTTVTGGLTPKVVLSPVGNGVQLMDASLAGTAIRVDKDQVIVGLAVPPRKAAVPINKFSSYVISTAPAPGTGEAAAAQVVAQQILRFQLPTPLIVAP